MIAGLDEAGRGAWAGPVVAAAVILRPHSGIPGVDDSKKLSPAQRDSLFKVIHEQALCTGVGFVAHDVIDRINILQASLLAMQQALKNLQHQPNFLLIDGCQGLAVNIPQKTLIAGDALSQSIGAASIIAKVTRDRMMVELEKQFPQFKFSRHKGYGTRQHQQELGEHGILPIHRKSYKPITKFCVNSQNQEG